MYLRYDKNMIEAPNQTNFDCIYNILEDLGKKMPEHISN